MARDFPGIDRRTPIEQEAGHARAVIARCHMQRPHSRALDCCLLVGALVEQDGCDGGVILERCDVQRRPEIGLLVEVRAPCDERSDRFEIARQHRLWQIDGLRCSGTPKCQERHNEHQPSPCP